MHGHHGHFRLLDFPLFLVLVGCQRYLGEESSHRHIGILVLLSLFGHELLHVVEDFLEVLLFRHVLRCIVGDKRGEHFRACDDCGGYCRGVIAPVVHLGESADKLMECGELPGGRRIYAGGVEVGMRYYLPHAYVGGHCGTEHPPHGCIADAADRSVDDAAQCLVVVGVHAQSEVCYRVLDFLTLVE